MELRKIYLDFPLVFAHSVKPAVDADVKLTQSADFL